MRIVLVSITLCVALVGCSRQDKGTLLQQGGELTSSERTHLAGIHPLMTNWTAHFSGVYVAAGSTQHVYLYEHQIGSSVSGSRADALVFDREGRLIDATIFGHRFAMPSSCSVLSISPLRVRFSFGSDEFEEVTGEYLGDDRVRAQRECEAG